MYSLDQLPAELIFEIAHYLELGDAIRLNSTCRQVRATLQLENFFWLLETFPNPGPEKDRALRQTSRLVLSRFLLYWLKKGGEDSDLRELIKHGASFAQVSCGDLVRKKLLDDGMSKRWMLSSQERAALDQVPKSLTFLLQNGASLHQVPGGIHELLGAVFRDNGCGPRTDLLLEHGASFGKMINSGHLLESWVRWGPSPEVDMLLAHGCKLEEAPEDMYMIYDEFGIDLDDDDDDEDYGLSERGEWELERAMHVLRQVERDIPSELPRMLEEVYLGYGFRGPIRYILLEEPRWSLRNVPGGVDKLLEDTKDIQNTVFLLRQGSSLDSVNTKSRVCEVALRDLGPGDDLDYLVESCGVSLLDHEGGINALLANTYTEFGPGRRVEYLINRWGADLKQVPGGLLNLLQRTALEQGLDSIAATQLTEDYNLSLHDVPCGLPYLLSMTMQDTGKRSHRYQLYKELIASIQDDKQALDLVLEGAYRRLGQSPAIGLLLEHGASFDRAPEGSGALVEHIWRKHGVSPHLEFLLQNSKATLRDAPIGIDALLEWQIFRGAGYRDSLYHADRLIAEGASLARTPSGGREILGKIVDWLSFGSTAQWLVDHGARDSTLDKSRTDSS